MILAMVTMPTNLRVVGITWDWPSGESSFNGNQSNPHGGIWGYNDILGVYHQPSSTAFAYPDY